MAKFFDEGARQIRALTGFDRVMVYRFGRDGGGDVVGETVRPGLGRFLGLNYPASDIPIQARALYVRTPFRVIADINAAPLAQALAQRDAPLLFATGCGEQLELPNHFNHVPVAQKPYNSHDLSLLLAILSRADLPQDIGQARAIG